MGILSELLVGTTLTGGLVAVGLAGLQLRIALKTVEVSVDLVRDAYEFVVDHTKTRPPLPVREHVLSITREDDPAPELELADCLEKIEDKETDEEGKTKVVRTRTTNRHARGSFLRRLIAEAKCHFGGTPTATRANELAAMKFLVGKCRDHHLVVLHTKEVCHAAMVGLFTPDDDEIAAMAQLNSHAAYVARVKLHSAVTVDPWWVKILRSGERTAGWQQLWWVLWGAPAQRGFTYHK
ncbi:replication-related protein [Saguaro cactus virus]|nr:replication-related protein [Saguaro cactus virus]AAB36707.1 replication-related protein [Saguaro cactus virus]